MHAFGLEWRSVVIVAAALALAAPAIPQNPAHPAQPSAAGLLPKTEPAFPAPLPGNKTEGVKRILEILDWLAKYDRSGRNPANKVGFRLPESEVNEYLAYALRTNPRPGISSITVKLLPNSEVSSLVWIDFDTLAKWSWVVPKPLKPLLTGKTSVQVDGQFSAKDGQLDFTVKSSFGPAGTIIAKKVMEDMMQSIGQHQPESYSVGKPTPLPFGLKTIRCEKQILIGET